MAKQKRKFSLYLGLASATRATILSKAFEEKIEGREATKLKSRSEENADFDAYFHVSNANTPRWMEILSELFEVPEFSRRSPASVVVFEEAGRIFAATFGYGSKLLNEYQLEADFGIKVAINAVADDALRAVHKSNVASAIQQFAQSAFKSRFGSFGGQSKFEILKRVSGAVNATEDFDSVVGATGLSLRTLLKFADIKTIARKSLQLFASEAYKSTAFAVIDEFKPVLLLREIDRLNGLLVSNLRSPQSSFEICLPQQNFSDSGYVKISGAGLREEFPDVSLELYKSTFDDVRELTLDDLRDDNVQLYNDEHDNIGKWSIFRCLVGGMEDASGARYVLNEGHWYVPSEGIVGPVESFFDQRKLGADAKLDTFAVITWNKDVGSKGRSKLVPVYEDEEDYNKRVAHASGFVLFDQVWHRAADGKISKLEVCDLYDPENLRMIHVKRTSRQPSMLAYLFEQGQRAADLWQRDDVKTQFIERVRESVGDHHAKKLAAAKPSDLTIEFAIADYENIKGHHTIPFLGKLSFEMKARDIELRGFKSQVRFIPLEKPKRL